MKDKDYKVLIKGLEKDKEHLYDEIAGLETALKNKKKKDTLIEGYFPLTEKGVHIKHGLVSDTHMGSVYNNLDFLNTLYDIFKKEKVEIVFHCGDLCDGDNMYRGHGYELYAHGADKQTKNVIDNYPKGFMNYFITGSHDLSFQKRAGVDIGEKIFDKRHDMEYIGPEESTIEIGNKEKKIKMMLMHPSKGTAYAISYHPQKIAESFSGGNKPDVLYIGHFHKAEMLPCQRNIQIVQSGCLEHQTPFMARNFISAHQGGWIIDMYVNKDHLISRFNGEFFAHYEKKATRKYIST